MKKIISKILLFIILTVTVSNSIFAVTPAKAGLTDWLNSLVTDKPTELYVSIVKEKALDALYDYYFQNSLSDSTNRIPKLMSILDNADYWNMGEFQKMEFINQLDMTKWNGEMNAIFAVEEKLLEGENKNVFLMPVWKQKIVEGDFIPPEKQDLGWTEEQKEQFTVAFVNQIIPSLWMTPNDFQHIANPYNLGPYYSLKNNDKAYCSTEVLNFLYSEVLYRSANDNYGTGDNYKKEFTNDELSYIQSAALFGFGMNLNLWLIGSSESIAGGLFNTGTFVTNFLKAQSTKGAAYKGLVETGALAALEETWGQDVAHLAIAKYKNPTSAQLIEAGQYLSRNNSVAGEVAVKSLENGNPGLYNIFSSGYSNKMIDSSIKTLNNTYRELVASLDQQFGLNAFIASQKRFLSIQLGSDLDVSFMNTGLRIVRAGNLDGTIKASGAIGTYNSVFDVVTFESGIMKGLLTKNPLNIGRIQAAFSLAYHEFIHRIHRFVTMRANGLTIDYLGKDVFDEIFTQVQTFNYSNKKFGSILTYQSYDDFYGPIPSNNIFNEMSKSYAEVTGLGGGTNAVATAKNELTASWWGLTAGPEGAHADLQARISLLSRSKIPDQQRQFYNELKLALETDNIDEAIRLIREGYIQ